MRAATPFPGDALLSLPERGLVRRKATNLAMQVVTALLTLIALAPLFWIIAYTIIRGGGYISVSFFTQLPRPMGIPGGGVLNAIEGTLVLTAIGAAFAVPAGVLTALYTAYHPATPLGFSARLATDVLSGVPAIVVGLFGYAIMVKPQGHYSALAGGIALAIIMFPTIVRTTEEMIKLVPQSFREGSLALGAPEWKTTLRVILPAATNGVVTGILIGLARASGETAPLLFTALGNENYEIGRIVSGGIASGQSILQIVNRIVEQPVDSLPLTLWKYAQQPFPERINQAWAAALVLMSLVLVVNIAARLWIQRQARMLQGK